MCHTTHQYICKYNIRIVFIFIIQPSLNFSSRRIWSSKLLRRPNTKGGMRHTRCRAHTAVCVPIYDGHGSRCHSTSLYGDYGRAPHASVGAIRSEGWMHVSKLRVDALLFFWYLGDETII